MVPGDITDSLDKSVQTEPSKPCAKPGQSLGVRDIAHQVSHANPWSRDKNIRQLRQRMHGPAAGLLQPGAPLPWRRLRLPAAPRLLRRPPAADPRAGPPAFAAAAAHAAR